MKQQATVDTIVIHHTGAKPSWDFRGVRLDHLTSRGWDDIGYHYFIEGDGVVVRGRGESVMGAHALGANRNSLGICLAGDFRDTVPTQDQLDALDVLLDDLLFRYDLGMDSVLPHQEVGSTKTECPGNWRFIRDELARRGHH